MHFAQHLILSWGLAEVGSRTGLLAAADAAQDGPEDLRARRIVTWAGILPDADAWEP